MRFCERYLSTMSMHEMLSSLSVIVESTDHLPVPGLDVGPPVQEDLDGLQVALLSSTVESGGPILSKYVYMEISTSARMSRYNGLRIVNTLL